VKSAVGLYCVVLAGCSTAPPMTQTEKIEAHLPISCTSKAQCDVMWQRAQVFVADHAGFKIQTLSDSIISTFGPTGSGTSLATNVAWSVTKLPTASGGAVLNARAGCGGAACFPDPEYSLLQFRRFVMTP